MRMTGSWHVYRPGEAWQKPRALARVVLETERFVAVCLQRAGRRDALGQGARAPPGARPARPRRPRAGIRPRRGVPPDPPPAPISRWPRRCCCRARCRGSATSTSRRSSFSAAQTRSRESPPWMRARSRISFARRGAGCSATSRVPYAGPATRSRTSGPGSTGERAGHAAAARRGSACGGMESACDRLTGVRPARTPARARARASTGRWSARSHRPRRFPWPSTRPAASATARRSPRATCPRR